MMEIIRTLSVILLGWAAGAFVNYISDVMPIKRRLVAPFCLQCGSKYTFVNYVFWPRRCSSCNKRRSWRVWIVELAFIAFSLWIWQSPPDSLGFFAGLLLMMYFGVVVVIDLEYKLIMHPVSLVGVALGLYIGVISNGFTATIIGGIVGFGVMWLLYMLGELILKWVSQRRGQSSEEVALGFGDVNLSGVLGLMLGWPGILVGLTWAILLGGIVSMIYLVVMLILRRYQLFSALPYGPFLVAGAFLLIYLGDTIPFILWG